MKYIVTLNNKRYEVEVEQGEASIINISEEKKGEKEIKPEVMQSQSLMNSSREGEKLKAPMPGTILDIKVIQGAAVRRGDVLFILEAMKMENEITATKDGVIVEVLVEKGTAVTTGDVLAVIE